MCVPVLVAALVWLAGLGAVCGAKLTCEEARLKCAYRTGCGQALQNFMVGCSAVLRDSREGCPESCQHALIALTSTDEGASLMTCDCTDEMCRETKERVEVCRPHVARATRNDSLVSCRVAEWICRADGVCSNALDYYHHFCRSMFQGRKCNNRCKNSINILRRQEKAAKLTTCVCDGREEYDCLRIRGYMARLCFHKEPDPPPAPTLDTEPPEGGGDQGPSEPGASSPSHLPPSWSLLLLPLCLRLLNT